MVSVKRYDHVAVGVHSFDKAVPFFRDILGGEYVKSGEEPEQGYRWVQFRYPSGEKIELLEPMGDEGFLHEFLAGRGEGLHHITLYVQDLRASIAELSEKGYRVVRESYSDPDWYEAFVHPRSAHGVLIQLVQRLHDD